MKPCLFGQFRPFFNLFLNFVRKVRQLASTRPVGFAAGKNKATKLQPKLWFGSTVGSQTLGPPTDESLQAKVNPA